ncbi:uncharacterized protein LOC129242266 [Anastrepha obliqua]|uniref:uncharacterized protein LOC129242266 n=1 Tax=Anastrepha obliqua TaxID=95512 RepID=UPI00240A03AD|nr:uncharacterized protein LOC129242266 [Anastrepha obliqua]
MKLFRVALVACFVAFAIAQSVPEQGAEPSAEYLPPVDDESAPLTEDGYRYKAVRRLKYRHRREVPSEEYLPPVVEPSADYIPPEGPETRVADDGYRYKTVRRLKVHRKRREAPSVEYLPPVTEPSPEYIPPESAETRVADDGYRYKTVRRLRYRARHRRDVSELPSLPSGEYLPPVDVELAPELKTVLGDDGYRYKTVRRLKFRRHRRETEAADEVDAPNGEYLPPSNDVAEEPEPKSAELAQDGYRYKTVRRLKYRYPNCMAFDCSVLQSKILRDLMLSKLLTVALALCLVSLTIAQSIPAESAEPAVDYLPPVDENSAPVAEDGYRYKAVRRLKYRNRRDVPSEEYLPPVTEPSPEYLPPGGAETRVADDGYRYKTVRRLRFRARHRRDVSELPSLPSNEYLPPVDVELAPELKTVLGDDGYRYKTVRRLKFRRHRREAEAAEEAAVVDIPNNEYLPPSNDVAEEPEPKSVELAQDGYRYKTVRRFRYRHRQ